MGIGSSHAERLREDSQDGYVYLPVDDQSLQDAERTLLGDQDDGVQNTGSYVWIDVTGSTETRKEGSHFTELESAAFEASPAGLEDEETGRGELDVLQNASIPAAATEHLQGEADSPFEYGARRSSGSDSCLTGIKEDKVPDDPSSHVQGPSISSLEGRRQRSAAAYETLLNNFMNLISMVQFDTVTRTLLQHRILSPQEIQAFRADAATPSDQVQNLLFNIMEKVTARPEWFDIFCDAMGAGSTPDTVNELRAEYRSRCAEQPVPKSDTLNDRSGDLDGASRPNPSGPDEVLEPNEGQGDVTETLSSPSSQTSDAAASTFHCLTPGCEGFCFCDDELSEFTCPICNKRNCLQCKAIHEGQSCQEYCDKQQRSTGEDATVKAAPDLLEQGKPGLQGRVTTLQQNKTELEGWVTSLQQDKVELEGKVTALQRDKAGLEERVTTLQRDKGGLEGRVTSLQWDKAGLEGRVTTLQQNITELEGWVTSLQQDKVELEGKVTALQRDKAGLEGRVTTLQRDKGGLEGRVTSLQQDKARLEGQGTSLQQDEAGLEGQVTSLQQDEAGLEGRVTSLQQDKARLEGQMPSLQQDKAGLEGQEISLPQDKARIEGEVATLQQDKAGLEGHLSSLPQDKAELEGRVTALQQDKARLEGQVTTLQQDKAELEEEVAFLQWGNTRLEVQTVLLQQELAIARLAPILEENKESEDTVPTERPEDTASHHSLQASKASSVVTTDPKFPGICFLGTPWKEWVTSEGLEISWEDIGIAFSIPPGAVPKDKEPLSLTVRPCLAGPFQPPDGYEFTSPVCIVSPAFEFAKDITMVLFHCAYLQSDEDCELMSFLSAPSSPHYDGSSPRYKFKPLRGGLFQKKLWYGTISLKHFCEVTSGRKRSCSSEPDPDMQDDPKRKQTSEPELRQMAGGPSPPESNRPPLNYSVRLYRNSPPPGPYSRAVFCITWWHPIHVDYLDKVIKKEHQMMYPSSTFQPVQLAADRVELQLPGDSINWTIVPDRDTTILKRHVDSVIYNMSGELETMCPPMIYLRIQPRRGVPKLTEEVFKLKVEGVEDVNVSFNIMTDPDGWTKPQDHLSMDPLQSSGKPPTMRELMRCLYNQVPDLWKEIGTMLDINKPTLNSIGGKNFNNPHRCLMDMLDTWLACTDPLPTWEALAEAVEFLGRGDVAKSINPIHPTGNS